MNQQFQVILQQMTVFVVLLGIGAIAARAKVLRREVLDSLAKVVVNITLPAMIITLVPEAGGREVLIKALPMLFCSFLLILFLFLIGRLVCFCNYYSKPFYHTYGYVGLKYDKMKVHKNVNAISSLIASSITQILANKYIMLV